MGLNFGGPAVLGLAPVRPVTLRRHLSMVLPLSKLRRGSTDQIRSFSKTSWPSVPFGLRSPASRRRQKIYRVHNRHGLHAFLRAEIDRLDAVHYLSDEIRRIHVSRLQLAH
jgi:hypothetical protein